MREKSIDKEQRVPWTKFIRQSRRYLGKVGKEFIVTRADGSYLRVKYFSPYREDMAIKIKQEEDVNNNNKGEHRCHICGSSYRVIWVVPFDAKVSPGWYCYKCRKKRDILDIKIAKKYGKVV